MSTLYCICDFAVLIPPNVTKEQQKSWHVFKHKKKSYKLLMPGYFSFHGPKYILEGLEKTQDFLIEERTDYGSTDVFLSIFLRILPTIEVFYSSAKAKIVDLCFKIESSNPQNLIPEEQMIDFYAKNFNSLYQMLRREHARVRPIVENLDHLQSPELRPILRPYQLRAVHWMLERERKTEFLVIPPILMKNDRFPGQQFYMDQVNWRILDREPAPRVIPRGGLLCDEVGLGKTVEMLSLILQNKRDFTQERNEIKAQMFNRKSRKLGSDQYDIRCVCITVGDKVPVILCPSCETLQHQKCVLKHSKKGELGIGYRCPDCWKKSGEIVKSGATIIVSPASIKLQWLDEIRRHVVPELKIFLYDGVVKTGWISPVDLADYDVILTDYNILTPEILYTSNNQRALRKESTRAKPLSPLPMIEWWRAVLDEAQMVETSTKASARMVKSLPAVNRWAVTGTPIEKNLSSLFGLIYFIGFDPYCHQSVWNTIVHKYSRGQTAELVQVLQKVMWRTSKSDIPADEIGIPPQEDVLHCIEMSDLQKFFYRNEHAQFRSIFIQKSQKYRRQSIEFIDASILKKLLEPLRKLRQDCTIPTVMRAQTGGIEQMGKQLLSPNELHDHLITNAEKELKISLRTVASSFNGIAGCHILRNEIPEAIKCYENVLKLREEEVEKKPIGLDTLLQIHAIHNLLQIAPNYDKKPAMEKLLMELEEKFIKLYAENVQKVKTRLVEATNQVKKAPIDLQNDWWRVILHETTDENALIEKIQLDLRDLGFQKDFNSLNAFEYVLTLWLDDLVKSRKAIKKSFKDLQYFSDNIRAKHSLNEDELFKLTYLIESALACHLDILDDEDDDDQPTRSKGPKCQLCRVKSQLNEYECKLFNKRIVKNVETGEENVIGNWSLCYQEQILKSILAFAKRNAAFYGKFIDLSEDDKVKEKMKIIEAIKDEFKELSQFWVEINYSAGAYDELNMCKARLEAFDPNDEEMVTTQGRNSNMRVPRGTLNMLIEDFKNEKMSAEKLFIQQKGRLKYLYHLKQDKETTQNCPICKQEPEEKYAVLQCGHLMCFICVNQMSKFQRQQLTCAVCRHKQHYRDVLYVTCNIDNQPEFKINGSYSAKIIGIVKEIVKLKQKEPNVKIVIFSQWENILVVLESALSKNSISHVRTQGSGIKFHQTIEKFKDFKQNVTCLLMPLKSGSKGLNLIEATHVFLVEPLLDPSEEKQAVGRVHRIGQTRPTFVHRFIMEGTIEEKIYRSCQNWNIKEVTVDDIQSLFELDDFDVEVVAEAPMENMPIELFEDDDEVVELMEID